MIGSPRHEKKVDEHGEWTVHRNWTWSLLDWGFVCVDCRQEARDRRNARIRSWLRRVGIGKKEGAR